MKKQKLHNHKNSKASLPCIPAIASPDSRRPQQKQQGFSQSLPRAQPAPSSSAEHQDTPVWKGFAKADTAEPLSVMPRGLNPALAKVLQPVCGFPLTPRLPVPWMFLSLKIIITALLRATLNTK